VAYRIYVRLKSGGQATGRELHNGVPPELGTELDVPLTTGRIVKARVSSSDAKFSKASGDVATAVYANEI